MREKYAANLRAHNISGMVLLHCDMRELKPVMEMNFGDWEIFQALVQSMRDHEHHVKKHDDQPIRLESPSQRRHHIKHPTPVTGEGSPDPEKTTEKEPSGHEAVPNGDDCEHCEAETHPLAHQHHHAFGEALMETAALRNFVEAAGVNGESKLSEDDMSRREEEEEEAPKADAKKKRKISKKQRVRIKELDPERPESPRFKHGWASDTDSDELQRLYEKTKKSHHHHHHHHKSRLERSALVNASKQTPNHEAKPSGHYNIGVGDDVVLSIENNNHPQTHLDGGSGQSSSSSSSSGSSSSSRRSSQASLEEVDITLATNIEQVAMQEITWMKDKARSSSSESSKSSASSSRSSSPTQSSASSTAPANGDNETKFYVSDEGDHVVKL